MGCASSNPLVEGGKNLVTTAKDSVNDVVAKGEHTIHEAGDAAKEGMEHVKEAVESAMNTVENSLGNVVGKVSNTFNSTKNNVSETIDAAKENTENITNEITEGVTEAISDAETVIVSEKDNAKDMLATTATKTFKRIDSMTDEFGEAITERKDEVVESLHIEDMEQSIDTIDTNYKDMKRKAEDLVNGLSTPSPQPPSSENEHEDKKEEPPPTFWEAAADAILEQRIRPSLDLEDTSDVETEIGSESETTRRQNSIESDTELPNDDDDDDDNDENDDDDVLAIINGKNLMRPPAIVINSENLSVKSYKSES